MKSLYISSLIFRITRHGFPTAREFGGITASEKKAEEIQTYTPENVTAPYVQDGAAYYFKAQGQYLSVYNGSEFEDIYIKGVNLGLGKGYPS